MNYKKENKREIMIIEASAWAFVLTVALLFAMVIFSF